MLASRQPAAQSERESASAGGRDPDGASNGVGGKPAGQREIDRHRCRINVGRAQCHAHDLIERGIRAGHFSCLIQRYRYARRDSEGPLNIATNAIDVVEHDWSREHGRPAVDHDSYAYPFFFTSVVFGHRIQ